MHSDRTLLELVGFAYEAAADPTQWTAFLQRLGRALGTPWAVFHVHDLARRQCDVTAEVGFDPEFRRSYEEYYVSKNVFFTHGKHQLRPGNVCLETMLCPDEVLFASEFYADWIAPQGMLRGINGTVMATDSLVSLIGFIRKKGAGFPGERDVALIKALMPHLQRSVQLHQRFAELTALQRTTKDALDRWSMGVILLDCEGRVVLVNRAAEELLRKRDGLTYGVDGLRASRSNDTARLRLLIRTAVISRNTPTIDPGGVMTIERPRAEGAPLRLLIAPLAPETSLRAPTRAACAVFVSDADDAGETDCELLGRLYGLTPTESKVAALLVQGKDVRDVTDELNVSFNTARTHIKRVLRKTNSRRQAELVVRVLWDPSSRRLKDPKK